MYTQKTQTWKDNWNDVIRYVLFKDTLLKELLLLPEPTTIVQFVDKYFVQDEAGSEILTDEKVRIVYCDTRGKDTGNKGVRIHYKEFDIFVRDDVLHNATDDRLQNRYDLIADRLKYLLLRDRNVCGLHFEFEDEYNLWTKTIGYRRYHVVFSYKTTV